MKSLSLFSAILLLGGCNAIEISALRRKWQDETLQGFTAEDLKENPFKTAHTAEDFVAAQSAQMKLNYFNSLSDNAQKKVSDSLSEAMDPALKTINEARRHQANMAADAAAENIALNRRVQHEKVGVYDAKDSVINLPATTELLQYDAQDIIDAQSHFHDQYVPWAPGVELAKKVAHYKKKLEADTASSSILAQQENMRKVKAQLETVYKSMDTGYDASSNSTSLMQAQDSPAVQTFLAQQKHMQDIEEQQAKLHPEIATAVANTDKAPAAKPQMAAEDYLPPAPKA